MKKYLKRAWRITSFALGAGIVFVTAGAIGGMSPLHAGFVGALGAILVVITALAFEFASRGEVSDQSFDDAINTGIQKVKADVEKKK